MSRRRSSGEQDPLARDRVRRGQLGPQHRVFHLAVELGQGLLLRELHQSGLADQPQRPRLVAVVDGAAHEVGQRREAGVDRPLAVAEAAIGPRQQPRRCALEQRQVPDDRRDRGDDLDGARPRADHGHPLAAEIVGVVPPRRVEDLTVELGDAGHVGELGRRQGARREHEHLTGDRAVARRDGPPRGCLVPRRVNQLRTGVQLVADAVALGHRLEVALDLALPAEGPRPRGVLREGERVEPARHVARRARVGVVAPRPADVGALFEQHEVAVAGLLQLDGHAHAGEPGSGDDRPRVRRKVPGRRRLLSRFDCHASTYQ